MAEVVILQGNVLMATATFTDAISDSPVDPSTVTFSYEVKGGTEGGETTLTYGSASSPAVGLVARTGTGVYVAEVDLTSIDGVLVWKWQSTGSGQASASGQLRISPLPF